MTTSNNPTPQPTNARKIWRSDICGHVEPVHTDNFDAYDVGDDEDCVHCPNEDCLARVELDQSE
jgi:hypothetical protein